MGPTVLMATNPSAPLSTTALAINPMSWTLGVSLTNNGALQEVVASLIERTYWAAIDWSHPMEEPYPTEACGQEKFNSTVSATSSKAFTKVMKSSMLFAESETFNNALKSCSLLSFLSSYNACSNPGLRSPTELPKLPRSVSQMTGSRLPGLISTWKLLVVMMPMLGTLVSKYVSKAGFVEATPLTVVSRTSLRRSR